MGPRRSEFRQLGENCLARNYITVFTAIKRPITYGAPTKVGEPAWSNASPSLAVWEARVRSSGWCSTGSGSLRSGSGCQSGSGCGRVLQLGSCGLVTSGWRRTDRQAAPRTAAGCPSAVVIETGSTQLLRVEERACSA